MRTNEKIVIYQTTDGETAIDIRLENDTIWLSANQMAALFDRDEKTIRKHVNNVFTEGELSKEDNTHFLRVDKVKQLVAFYTLDVIISVGYRVKSLRGTQFRIWANKILKDYLIKGYAINDKITQKKYMEFYPSVEEKAAMLLYLVTKNHSFSDGNKRIAATLFLWFMQNNGILYNSDGLKRISNGTLVALTLMIAESRPEEKDVMVKVTVNLINRDNL